MKKTKVEVEGLLPLTPAAFQILLALAGGECHGYAIMQEVERGGEGKRRMGPGTLYGSIKRLLGDGLIEESPERPSARLDDVRRRYYRLTKFGRLVMIAEAERLENLVNEARARSVLPDPKPAT
jgi:DNA-binding PadR family transcriptional regulator